MTAIVTATRDYVAGFGPTDPPTLPTPATSPTAGSTRTATPTTGAATDSTADRRFQASLAAAREQLAAHGCAAPPTIQALRDRLATIPTEGPVAGAVLRQLTASLTGAVEGAPVTRRVAVGEDLLAAVAELPAGSTIDLSAGTHRLDDVLVLLSPVTITGAGAGATTIESGVADHTVLAIADGVVGLTGLTVRHTGRAPANVVLVGPTASLVLTKVSVRGGVAERDGTGGAGILMYDPTSTSRRTATSLEVTGSRFSDNGSAGIVLTGGHVASIASSTFTGNQQCGICFLDDSGGSVQDSTLTGNAVGVAATGRSAPTVLRVEIRGGEVGVQAGEESAPVIDASSVTKAKRAALIWAGRAEGTIRGVTCRDVPFGLVVGPDVAPVVEGSRSCALARSE